MDYNKLQALAKARSAAAFAASPMSTMTPEDSINYGLYQGMSTQDKRSYGLAPAQVSEPSKMEQYLEAKNTKLNSQHALTSTSSGNALQQALSDMVDQQVYTTPDGSKYQEMYTKDSAGNTVITKVPYTQETKYGSDTRNLYIDNTSEGAMKLGLAATDKGGYYGRYKPELGGWKPGPKGVTPEDGALLDIQLPYNVATKFEHGVHSNRGQLANRAIGQGPVSVQDIADFGSGKTEYTTQNAPMWNQATSSNVNLAAGTPLPKPMERMHSYDESGSSKAEDGTLVKAGKALESGAFNLVSRGMQTGMHGIEGIGEAIGSEQLARGARVMQKRLDQQRKDGTYDKYLGYSPKQVQEYGEKFSSSVQKGEYWEALKGIASDPESAFIAFAQSTPEMAAMMTGVGLGAVVGINVNNNLYSLEQSAQAQGRETTATEKGTSVGLSVISTLLDRLGDKVMMGNKILPGKLTDAITATLSKMTPTVRNEVLGQIGGRLAKVGISTAEFSGKTAMEGATEGIQTIGENKASDISKMNMNLTQEEIDQALQATGVGLGAGAVGTAGFNPSIPYTVAKETLGGVKDITNLGLNKLAETATGKTAEGILGVQAAQEVETAGLTGAIDERRVKLTEDMTPDQVDNAMMVNATLDDIHKLDTTSPTYKQEVVNNLASIDLMKEDMGFNTEPTTETVQPTPTMDTTVEPTITPADVASKIVNGEVLTDADLQVQANEGKTIETELQKMKEEQTPAKKVEYQDNTVEQSAQKAGLVNFLSTSDKAKEIRVESIHDTGVRVEGASVKKPKLVPTFSIDQNVISNVLAGKMDETMASTLTNTKDNAIVNFAKRLGKKLAPSNTEVFQELQNLSAKTTEAVSKEGSKAKESMDKLFGETASNEKALRVTALVLDTVHSAMRSEYDINKKYNLKNDQTPQARRQEVVQQLGKELMNSFELRLAGKPEEMAKLYSELGEHMLTIAEDAELVEMGIKDVAIHNMVDAEGNRLSPKTIEKYYHAGKRKGTVSVPTVKVKSIQSTERGAYNPEVTAANTLSKLFKPINYELPTEIPVEDVPTQSPINPKHEKIIQEYNKLEYSVKPEALKVLKEIKEYIQKKYNGDTDKALSKDSMLINLLGLQRSDSMIRKNTEGGKAIGRKGTMINLLDNLDALDSDSLHFNFESAINQRIHVMQTVLDFQGDKYIARQILQGGKKEKKASGLARQLLVNNLADELKITPEEVENPTDKRLLGAMDTIDKTGTLPMSSLPALAMKLGVKSPFKLLSLVKAMSDIRRSNGGTVTTNYQVESDATASGVVNTLLNLSGHENVQKILGLLGVGVNHKGTDPYKFIASVLEKSPLYESDIKPILDELADVGVDARNVAKYPIMKWFYGQLDANNNADMGRDIAEDIVDKVFYESNEKALALINKILETNYDVDYTAEGKGNPISNMTEEEQAKLAEYFSKNLAEEYTNALNTTFAEVGGYRENMGKIYAMLKKTGKWKGSIRTAMDALLPGDKPYKMSVQKLKQMVFSEGVDTYTTNKMMDNETSFNVNLQHATDAALLLMSVKDVLGENYDGVMTVHDALYSDPETALKIMERYNHYTVEAALKYDYMDTALAELKDALDAMEDSPLKKEYTKTYETMKATNDALMNDKKAFLEGKVLNILGDWEVGHEVAMNAKEESTTDVKKPETNTEIKKANEKVYSDIKAPLDAIRYAIENDSPMEAMETIRGLEVSESHRDLLDKVNEALMKGTELVLGDQYSGGYNQVQLTKTGYGITQDTKHVMSVDTLVEVLAHEVDHAIQLDWMANNKDSVEMKYLSRIVQKLGSIKDKIVSPHTRNRINYILDPRKGDYKGDETLEMSQVAELVSILSNEKTVSEDILSALEGQKQNILDVIARLISKAYKSFKEMLGKGDVKDLLINTEVIMSAIQSLDDNAKLNTLHATGTGRLANATNATEQKDINKDMFLNPYDYVNEGIAKSNRYMSDWMIIWGSVIGEQVSPRLTKAHNKMKHAYPIYREGVNLLRHGFYDSDFAQRMHYILGVTTDTKDKVIKEALSLYTKYQQESSTERVAMAEMDRQIKDKYSKNDRVVVHQLFGDTAIANLILNAGVKDSLLNGEKTLEQLLGEVGGKLSEDVKTKLDEVAKYWVTNETEHNAVNVKYSGNVSDNAHVYATLKAISMIDGGVEILTKMEPQLRNWMMSLALLNKKLNDEINEKGLDYQGRSYSEDAGFHGMYDGSYSMDIHDTVYEHKAVTLGDMRKMENSSEYEWEVTITPTKTTMGVISRISRDAGRVSGVGLEMNRYTNGIFLSSEQSMEIADKLDGMSEEDREIWLNKNKMVQDGRRFRVLVSKKTKVEKLSMMQNAAHSLYRTYIHNKELVQAESIRQIMLENGTRYVKSAVGMKELEATLRENDRKGVRGKLGERVEVEPFINIDYTSEDLKDINSFDELRKKYPMVAKYYKIPEGLTSFNKFNQKISLVKRGVSDVLLGHKNFSLFGGTDNRELAKYEQMFKKMIIMIKQKMVVTNPVKLLNDSITNIGLLSMMDVGIVEIMNGYKNGLTAYKEYAAARTKLVNLTMNAKMADAKYTMEPTKENEKAKVWYIKKMDTHKAEMEKLEFHDAFNAGFVQSYSTDLVMKEFDTISGIQSDIDKFVDKYTHDKKGNPNKLFDAIKWWQNAGIGMDEVLRKMGEMAKINETDVGTELVELADRLKAKKADKESVSRYVTDIVGGPASEAVNYGSAYMVLADALSKYILAKHLMTQENPRSGERGKRRKYTKEEAYSKANDTFIDYRTNMPHEIKALSDYGVMMFPAFWMKIQKVIAGLIKYHPVSALGSYAIETAMGAGSLNVLNQALPIKFGGDSIQTMFNNPIETVGENIWSVPLVIL